MKLLAAAESQALEGIVSKLGPRGTNKPLCGRLDPVPGAPDLILGGLTGWFVVSEIWGVRPSLPQVRTPESGFLIWAGPFPRL